MNRKKLSLAILLIVFAASIVYSFIKSPKEKRVKSLKYQKGSVEAPADLRKPSAAVKPNVKPGNIQETGALKHLDLQVADFKGVKRNIFKPIFREEVKVSALPPPPPAPSRRENPTKQAAQSILPQSTSKAPPSVTPKEEAEKKMGKLRFVGFLGKDSKKTIFLAEGSEVYLVKKGDKIAGKYEVTRLTDDAVTISVAADGSDLVFPLIENRSLTVGKR